MNEKDIKKLQEMAKFFRSTSGKIKIVSLLNRAKEEYNQNKHAQCIATCKKILAKDANNPVALRGIGCVMQSMKNYEKAVQFYLKALQFSKNKEIEYTLLGNLYYQKDDLDNAIKYFNLAIDANDNYDKAYEGRNQAMLENHLKIIDLQDSLIKRNVF